MGFQLDLQTHQWLYTRPMMIKGGKLNTVKGRQLIQSFQTILKDHIFPIAGTVTECYSQFPKQDASKLCIATFEKYFAERELLLPWNIIILDNKQDGEPYAIGTQNIEVIMLFKVGIDTEEVIEVNINMGSLDALIIYKKLVDCEWRPIDDDYLVMAKRVNRANRSVSEYDTILDWTGKH